MKHDRAKLTIDQKLCRLPVITERVLGDARVVATISSFDGIQFQERQSLFFLTGDGG